MSVHATRDLFGAAKRGEYVDEAEQLDLERLVPHGPVEDLAAPPAAVEERGNLLPRKLEDLFSELLDLAFERFVAVHAERLA